MPLVGINWFWNAEVFPLLREFQKKTKGDPKFYQHGSPTGRLVPLDQKKWDWYDQ